MLVSVQERCRFTGISSVLDQGVCFQHRVEAGCWGAGLVPHGGKPLEMALDMPLVPGDQDRFDIGIVVIERRSADPGPLRDLRHRDGSQAALVYQRGGSVEDCVSYLLAMRRKGCRPKLRHTQRIHHVPVFDNLLDVRQYVSIRCW